MIFVVEDNSIYNKLIVNQLHAHKLIRTESYLSGEECLQNTQRKPDIIIQDYLLGGINGIDVLKATKKKYPDTEFIFLSGQDNIEVAVNSIKLGARDYIVKDQYALKKLTDKINKIMKNRELINNNKRYKRGIRLFFIALAIIMLIFVGLTILFPKTFSIMGN
jgi:DNA-binding NtrC family response regulator